MVPFFNLSNSSCARRLFLKAIYQMNSKRPLFIHAYVGPVARKIGFQFRHKYTVLTIKAR